MQHCAAGICGLYEPCVHLVRACVCVCVCVCVCAQRGLDDPDAKAAILAACDTPYAKLSGDYM